jgi:hypothetical protein
MRFAEFIKEDSGLGSMVEDEAETRGDSVLATALEELRNRAHGHAVPRVRVDSLVNLVKKLPGGEMFNVDALENARKSNDTIKNLITDIKDDENGVKYVYLATFSDDEFGDEAGIGGDAQGGQTAPEKTVSSMANRALGNRS